jgi:hypothetical protein
VLLRIRKEGRIFSGEIVFPAKDLGEEGGKRIDVLFGAVTLENWGTIIDESTIPPRVDHSLLRKGELIEL